MPIKVLFVDDHEMVRIGISSYLSTQPDIEVVGEGKSGKEAIQLAHELFNWHPIPPYLMALSLLFLYLNRVEKQYGMLHLFLMHVHAYFLNHNFVQYFHLH